MVVTGGSCLPDHLLLVLLDLNLRSLFDRLLLLLLLAGSEHESDAGESEHGDGLHMMMIVVVVLIGYPAHAVSRCLIHYTCCVSDCKPKLSRR